MKKNFIYALIACFTLSLAACSTDPEDATSKHVYGENENPYLKTNADAVVSTKAEFPISRLEAKTVKLTDYAEKFHTYLGMTVDETLSALSNGSVVFYPINISKNCWNRTAPTKGTNGWYYNTAGGVCEASSGIASIELDATNKELVLNVLETASVGTIMSVNVGFAINNGADFDDYIRFSFDVTVTDPSKIVISGTLPAGDYAGFSINFADHVEAIESCTGLSLDEFSKEVKNSGDARSDSSITPTIAMYPVKEDGTWDEASEYTANGLGYWFDGQSKVASYGDNCVYFIESGEGSVFVGRYPNIASGTTIKAHFVYVMIDDHSRYVEFIVSGTME